MLNLPTITLCSISSVEIDKTIHALKKSMEGVSYADVILFTDKKIILDDIGIKVININSLDYDGYSEFVLYKLKDYITTDFALIVQHDGYVLRPEKWSNDFLEYDYIGAPWPEGKYFTNEGINVRVGNGGFSLRSKKMLSILSDLNLPFTDNGTGFSHEDGVICAYYRKTLEEHGIKYAPVNIASRFSRERWCPDSEKYPFGFHDNRTNFLHFVFKKLSKLFKAKK